MICRFKENTLSLDNEQHKELTNKSLVNKILNKQLLILPKENTLMRKGLYFVELVLIG
jgi:hypothetical protein